jgi:hypothetical protein
VLLFQNYGTFMFELHRHSRVVIVGVKQRPDHDRHIFKQFLRQNTERDYEYSFCDTNNQDHKNIGGVIWTSALASNAAQTRNRADLRIPILSSSLSPCSLQLVPVCKLLTGAPALTPTRELQSQNCGVRTSDSDTRTC